MSAARKADAPAGPSFATELPRHALDYETPYRSAQILLDDHFTTGVECDLIHTQACFYLYRNGHYEEVEPDILRSRLFRLLDGGGYVSKEGGKFNPLPGAVSAITDCLQALTEVPTPATPPAWLIEQDGDTAAAQMLVCRNGLLDLTTRRLQPHSRRYFTLSGVDYDYEPRAPAPKEWFRFLNSQWATDPGAVACLQEIFGLLCTSYTGFQKVFVLIGFRRSGKGTIARMLKAVLGAGGYTSPSLSDLGAPFGMQPLIGKSVAVVSDARLTQMTDAGNVVERMLRISGEDPVNVNRKNLPYWIGTLAVRFVLLCNRMPALTDPSGAFAGRLVALHLPQSFYGREDLGLLDRLMPERSGILNWALDGRDRLFKRKRFEMPKSSDRVIKEVEELSSPVISFARDQCLVEVLPPSGGKLQTWVGKQELFSEWQNWRRERGHNKATIESFGADLRSAFNVKPGKSPVVKPPEVPAGAPPPLIKPRINCYWGIMLNPARRTPFGAATPEVREDDGGEDD